MDSFYSLLTPPNKRLVFNDSTLTFELKGITSMNQAGCFEVPPNATIQLDIDFLRKGVKIARVEPGQSARTWSEELSDLEDLFCSDAEEKRTVMLPGVEEVMLVLRAREKQITVSVLEDMGHY